MQGERRSVFENAIVEKSGWNQFLEVSEKTTRKAHRSHFKGSARSDAPSVSQLASTGNELAGD